MTPGWSKLSQAALAKLRLLVDDDTATNIRREQDEVSNMLRGGLRLRDNQYAAIVTVPNCVHGVQSVFQNPLPTVPLFFTPFKTTLANGSAALPTVGMPILDTTLGNKQLGLTANFAPPNGRVSLWRNANQTLAASVAVPIQYDTRVLADVGALSCDIATTTGAPPVNSKIVCAAAGSVLVNASVLIDRTLADTRLLYIGLNGSAGLHYGYCVNGTTPANTTYLAGTMAAEIAVVAGDYLSVFALHTTAGTTVATGGIQGPLFQARYVAPPVGYSANVTGILWGG